MLELGGVTTWNYDLTGNVVSSTDPLSRTTSATYDALRRRLTSTDPLQAVTSFTYDPVGNVLSVTDPESNTTLFDYDGQDRLISVTDALGHIATTDYDAVGNITRRVDRNGRERTFDYDLLNRLTTETWWSGTTAVNLLEYTRDAVGNLLTAEDAFSSYAFTYDPLNRPLTTSNLGTPQVPTVVLTNAWDAAGNRTSIADDQGITVSSQYDGRNLLTTRQWSGPGLADASLRYTYDLRGLPEEVQRYASLDTSVLVGSTSKTFDAKGRLTDLVHAGSAGQTLVNYHYVRDLADQLIEETHHGSTWEYTRDDFGQVLTATVNGVPTENYAYDDNGNRTTAGLITGTDNRLLENATHTFTYNAERNLTRRPFRRPFVQESPPSSWAGGVFTCRRKGSTACAIFRFICSRLSTCCRKLRIF